MDSDSDSDASHISATPPRVSDPDPLEPQFKVSASLKSNPKPKSAPQNRRKSKLKSKPKPSDPPPLPDFPSAQLANPHGLSIVSIRRPADVPNRATSFSRLVMSRRSSFDPSEFEDGGKVAACEEISGVSTEGGASSSGPPSRRSVHPNWIGSEAPSEQPTQRDCRREDKSRSFQCAAGASPDNMVSSKVQAKPKRVHPNWIGFEAPTELLKRPKCSREGNFVRLNLNGRGRRFTFKNGNRSSSFSSRGRRYRRRLVARKSNTSDEFVLDAVIEQRKTPNCNNQKLKEAVIAAREYPSDDNFQRLLKLTHGYDSFREGQLETIRRVVSGESTMLILPTGAGKSLCYELPALLLPGVTLVVSPLVALMVDQLSKLPSVIPGGLLSSMQTHDETSETLQKLQEGSIKVLFVSPERFLNAEFLSMFVDGLSISLLVIDEAHCISEWSHNFRPSYLRLKTSILRMKLTIQCILAMTATATTQTFHDIMCALEIQPSDSIKVSRVRENLQLFVTLSENRMKDLLLLMKASPLVDIHSIIVYCKFQTETDLVSKYLCDNNIPAKSYHSGIPAKNRSRIQELFCSNKIRVVVATVAFGMGLDKSDVQAVIHYSMPESLEEYVQETGRAGRDGKLSYCHLLLDVTTYYKLRSLSYSDGVDEYAVSKFLSQVFHGDGDLTGQVCSLVKESTSKKFDMKEQVLLTILTQLEIGDEQYLILLPPLNVTCSLYFHKTSPELLSNKDTLIASILMKSIVKDGHYVFDVPTVANNVRMQIADLLNKLQNLKSLGEVTYDLKDPAFCYIVVKKPDDFFTLSANLTKNLSQVESCKVQKVDAMFNVVWSAVKECKGIDGCSNPLHTACIQKKILDYFNGMHDPLDDILSRKMARSSPFLRADIKVFLQSNSHTDFTPRAIARIMHGIPSPAFPSSTWSKSHFWGRYVELDFSVVMEAAKLELINLVGKHAHRVSKVDLDAIGFSS